MSFQKKQYLKHIDNFVRFDDSDKREFYFPQMSKFSNLFSRLGSETRKTALKGLKDLLKKLEATKSSSKIFRTIFSYGFDVGTENLQAVIRELKKSNAIVTQKAFFRVENYLQKFALKDSISLLTLLLRIVFPGRNHIARSYTKRSGNPILEIVLDSKTLEKFKAAFSKDNQDLIGYYINGLIEGSLYSLLFYSKSHKVVEIESIHSLPKNILNKGKNVATYELSPRELQIPLNVYLKSAVLFSKHGTSYYSYNLDDNESLKQAGMLRGVEAVMKDCYGADVNLEDINLGESKVCFVRGKDLVLAYAFRKFREETALKFFMQNLFFEIEQFFKHSKFDVDGIDELPPHLQKKLEDELNSTSLRRFFSPFKPVRVLQPNPKNLAVAEKTFFVHIIKKMSTDMSLNEVVALVNTPKVGVPTQLRPYFKKSDFTLNNIVEICDVLQRKLVIE